MQRICMWMASLLAICTSMIVPAQAAADITLTATVIPARVDLSWSIVQTNNNTSRPPVTFAFEVWRKSPTSPPGQIGQLIYTSPTGSQSVGGTFVDRGNGLVPGQSYKYFVYGWEPTPNLFTNDPVVGASNEPVVTVPEVLPAKPTLSVGTQQGTGSHLLTWGTTSRATSYLVKVRVDPQGQPTVGNVGTSTSYVYGNTTPGIRYYYQVTAVNSYGSVDSDQLSAIGPTRPPTNVTAQAGNASVRVSWLGSPTATTYLTYVSEFPTTEFKPLSNQSGTTLNHRNLVNGKAYYYYVVAVGAGGHSVPSAIVGARPLSTLAPLSRRPSVPVG